MSWIKDLERTLAHSLEHGIDNYLDALFAHNPPKDLSAKIHAYLDTSPLVKFLGGMGMFAVPLIEKEIDSILAHNDTPQALVKIKQYVHDRLTVK